MEIRSRYKALLPRLEMFRRKMPRLYKEQVVTAMRLLQRASGVYAGSEGELGTLLVGYKPAVTFDLPDSTQIVRSVNDKLSALGFRYSSRPEPVFDSDERKRSGLIWSVAAACELYGLGERALARQIDRVLAPSRIGLPTLPGYLLGYAENSGFIENGYVVSIESSFGNIHWSRAKDRHDAELLARHYQAGARAYAKMVGRDEAGIY
jgi:hypothetical protein